MSVILHFVCQFCFLSVLHATIGTASIDTWLPGYTPNNQILNWTTSAPPPVPDNRWEIDSLHSRRSRRSAAAYLPSPPRILPDLPPIFSFFDRVGMQLRCQATGNPTPKISWYFLTNTVVDNKPAVVEKLVPDAEELAEGFQDLQMDAQYLVASDLSDLSTPADLQSRPPGGDTAAVVGTEGNLFVVGGGWLNVTVKQSSTLRRVFFCQARNYMGRARSRKVIIHQVPMPDKNLWIVYNTFPVAPNQKAVISCQTEQAIFNRFLKIKYWQVYFNGTLISTVYDSGGRFSLINTTQPPELHIRSITEAEFANLEVRCVLQSIVNETVVVERPERGRLQRLNIKIDGELRNQDADLSVVRGSSLELPWSVEGVNPTGVQWYFKSETTSTSSQQPQAIPPQPPGGNGTVAMAKYELVNGGSDNLRLINLSVADSGFYIAESVQLPRRLTTTYKVLVTAPLGVKISPREATVDHATRVELTCQLTGHPISSIYWLHNGKPRPRRHVVRRIVTGPLAASRNTCAVCDLPIVEQLVIEGFTLEDVGVYQCVVESDTSLPLVDHILTGAAPSPADDPTKVSPQEPVEASSSGKSFRSSQLSDADLGDNAQATALLTMGRMRPSLTRQHPAVESSSAVAAARVLLSIQSAGEAVSRVELACWFAANPAPQITWYRDDELIPLDFSGVLSPEAMLDSGNAYTTVAKLAINIRKVFNLDDLWTFGGEYRAVANNTHGQADCRTYVLLETPLRIRAIKVPDPAIAGRTSTLKCYVIGSSIASIQWHRIKSDQDVQRIPVDHRHQLFEGGRVLRITDVSKEDDQADYRCTAGLADLKVNLTVSLTVSHAPRLIDLPQTREMKFARDVLSYNCALRDRADQPWYAWWEFQREGTNSIIPLPPSNGDKYNGLSVSYVKDTAFQSVPKTYRLPDSLRNKVPQFVHYEPNAAVLVTANEPRRDLHQGNLTCVVLNEVGEDRRSIRVTFIPELEFAIRPPNNQDVILGENIAIDCTAKSSDLEPVVDWRFFNKTIRNHISISELTTATNGRIVQLSNGTLVLNSVAESDPREFLCFLKPASDSSSAAAPKSVVVNLEVHAPARVDPIENVEKVRGSRFNLTCSVHGDPEELRAAWYYRRPPGAKWLLIDKPCVLPETGEANGYPANSHEEDKSSGQPVGTIGPGEQFSALTGCQSFATEGQESKVLFRQTSVFKPNKRGLDRNLEFFNVKEMHMGEYMCRASNQYNRDADGRQSHVETSARLTVTSVPDPVTFIHNNSRTTATTVSFAWQPPLRDGNKPIRKYRIRYSHSEPAGVTGKQKPQQPNVSEEYVPADQHKTELTNLRPYTKYHITVVAINDVGSSSENSLALTTQEAKPGGPVRNLVANGTASDTITVSWDNPATELLNGNVDRYWVCRQRLVNSSSLTAGELAKLRWPEEGNGDLEQEEGGEPQSVATASSHSAGDGTQSISHRSQLGRTHCLTMHRQRDHEITGLPKFTAYAFRVVAMNSKGASPPAYTQARTLEDLPQAAPTDVKCTSQQHSITVSWNPPDADTINGILTEYHVSYFAANVYGDETSSVNQAVQGQTTVTLAGLVAFTNYTVQVAVSNRKGRGPSSPRLLCLTRETLPEAPGHIKASPLNSSCVVVSWTHPDKPNGLTRKYCLEALPIGSGGIPPLPRVKGPCVPPNISTISNHYLYCGLTEYQPYNVSVWAVNLFEGKRISTSPVTPIPNPESAIISIGDKIVTQNKMRVAMDCLAIGDYPLHWTYPNDHLSDLHVSDNGTLIIDAVEVTHTGRYTCTVGKQSITYSLTVQEILEEPPRQPIWLKFTPSLRGIQAEWRSPGSRRLDAPILWFHLNWTNRYSGVRDSVRLPADQRTFYLSNLTCATTVNFQLAAENKVGRSPLTDVTSWTTLGSAPQAADAAVLIPSHLRYATWVTLNLSNFLPGNQCPPLGYHLLITPAEDGHFGLKKSLVNLSITRADLITVDFSRRERCCFNVTNLNSGSHYHYKLVARNPAGQAELSGQFWTLTVAGSEPVLKQTHIAGPASLLQRPIFFVPVAALLACSVIAFVAVFLLCRNRRLEVALQPPSAKELQEEAAADMLRGHPARDRHAAGYYYRQRRHNDLQPSSSSASGGKYHGYTAGVVAVDSQGRADAKPGTKASGGVLARWLSRLYDQSGQGKRSSSQPHQSQKAGDSQLAPEDDRLSTHSIDSEGNLNPYATYAASGFTDQPDAQATGLYPLSNGMMTQPKTTVGSAEITVAGQSLPYSRGHPRESGGHQWIPSQGAVVQGLYRAAVPNSRLVPTEVLYTQQGASTRHHYHYPNLSSGQSRLYRVGSVGRLIAHPELADQSPANLFNHQHQQQQQQARTLLWMGPRKAPGGVLIPPAPLPPYDNSTFGTMDSRDEATMGAGLRPRRVNSFDSLHQLGRGTEVGPTYHHGFMPGLASRAGPPTFYDLTGLAVGPPDKQSDPAVAYRGSLLSSATTASSNQDELVQAYEYGRRNQGPRAAAFVTGQPHLLLMVDPQQQQQQQQTAVVGHRMPLGGVSAGSSDENTDSGIRQFTQQPPRPEEARHGACEVTLRPGGGVRVPKQSGLDYSASTCRPSDTALATRHRLLMGPGDSDQGTSDTYASVDYGVPSSYALARGPRAAAYYDPGMAPLAGRTSSSGRPPGVQRTSSRARQPLPALPGAVEGRRSEGGNRIAGLHQDTGRSALLLPRGRLPPTGEEVGAKGQLLPLVAEISAGGHLAGESYAIGDSTDPTNSEAHTLLPRNQTTLTARNGRPWTSRVVEDPSTAVPPSGGEEENIYTSEFVLV